MSRRVSNHARAHLPTGTQVAFFDRPAGLGRDLVAFVPIRSHALMDSESRLIADPSMGRIQRSARGSRLGR